MLQINATEAKMRFGKLLHDVQKNHIEVMSHDRSIAVIMSKDEYERYIEMEDAYWGNAADQAIEEDDFMSAEESKKFLVSL